jgi:uncharacterized protein (TIGR03083 family)
VNSRANGTATDVDLVERLWRRWAEFGHGLAPADWDTATRLTGWSVRTLFAHVARGVGVLHDLVGSPVEGPVDRADAAEYFTGLRGVPGAAKWVDQAAREAAEAAPAEMIRWFEVDGPRVLDDVRAAGPLVVRSPSGNIALADFILTRVVEATVHLLDARHALTGVDHPEPAALGRVTDVLVAIAGPADFIDLATGRSAAPLFPVLT